MSTPLVLSSDPVVAIAPEQYERDRRAVARALLAAGAESVFEIGSVSVPGISDLDLLASFPDDHDWTRGSSVLEKCIAERPTTFLHRPWGMRARHLELLPNLFAIRQMRDLGTGRLWEVVQTDIQRLLWNIEASASVLALLSSRAAHMTARSALCLLNGIVYNLELNRTSGRETERGAEFARRITDLRRSWFAGPMQSRTAELGALWTLASEVLREILRGCADAVVQRYGIAERHDLSIRVPGSHVIYCFTDGSTARRVIARPFAHVLALPAALGGVFELLAEPGLGLDTWLRPQRGSVAGTASAGVDPSFLAGVRAYARANASYLGDMMACRLPVLLLTGGTFVHLQCRRPGGLRRLLSGARGWLSRVRN